MNSRYLTNVALALVGGFGVVASQVWSVPVFMWIMLGTGAAAIALAGFAAMARRGVTQRALDGAIGAIGAWTIVASLVFAGTVVTWLGFASGLAFVALALTGLTLHELSTERVVHSFELRTPHADPEHAEHSDRAEHIGAERELAGMR